eukprot:scaffold32894_cov79-Isochrysis_galbana.AAC.1
MAMPLSILDGATGFPEAPGRYVHEVWAFPEKGVERLPPLLQGEWAASSRCQRGALARDLF